MHKKIRIISYHPSRSTCDVPFLALGGKWLAKEYGWEVGGLVEVVELPNGLFIKRLPTPENPNQMKLFDKKGGGL